MSGTQIPWHSFRGKQQESGGFHTAMLAQAVWPGIDVILSSSDGNLKSEFVVAPGADLRGLRVRYDNARRLSVGRDGALRIETPAGIWTEHPPDTFQDEVRVEARYRIWNRNTVTVELGAYDASRPVRIDPLLTFSATFGGSGTAAATAVSAAPDGSVYVAGYTDAADFPSHQTSWTRGRGVEVVVMKFRPSGSRLQWIAVLGGEADDRAFAVAADPAADGGVYVAGWTTSRDFPVANAHQATLNGHRDAFLLKLDAGGSELGFSTYYGVGDVEAAFALVASPDGVWTAGDTQHGPLGRQDAFLARFTQAGALISGSFFGGDGDDTIRALALDSAGNLHAGGCSDSTNLTFAGSPVQPSRRGGQDAFVFRLGSGGESPVYGTWLGGSAGGFAGFECVYALAVDGAGTVYAGGTTPSMDFPIVSAAEPEFGIGARGFVSKLPPSFDYLRWSTFLGGTGPDSIAGLALDFAGRVWVGGTVTGSDLPTATPVQAANAGLQDGFLVRLEPASGAASFATFLGGELGDGVSGIAVTPAGRVWVAGLTTSPSFPAKDAPMASGNGPLKMFVSEVTLSPPPVPARVTPLSGVGSTQTFTAEVRQPDAASGIGLVEFLIGLERTASPGCQVRFSTSGSVLTIRSDAGMNQAVRPGTGDVAGNSYCDLLGVGSAVTVASDSVVLTVTLTFKPAFAGSHQVFINAWNTSGDSSGATQLGAWTVPPPSHPPTPISVSPNAGSGAVARLTFRFSDTAGGADIAAAGILINGAFSGANACYIILDRLFNAIYLASDSGAAWQLMRMGSSSVIGNSQCQVKGFWSRGYVQGSEWFMTLDLAFRPSFSGVKTIQAFANDKANAYSPWTSLGTFTVQ